MPPANPVVNLRQAAAAAAQKYGVPVPVFLRQIQQESGFNPNARSSAGAQGIAQFIPSTAKAYGLSNPYDPLASLDAAARYDASLIHQYGSVARALSAYNSGRPDAYKDPNFAGGQTYNYVRTILGGAPAAGTPPLPSPSTPTTNTAIPAALPAPPSRPSVSSNALAVLNEGARMFGLPPLPAAVATSSAPLRLPTAGTPPPLPAASPPTPLGQRIAKTALTQIGIPYQWGGVAKLGGRTDCSGLLQASAAANGVKIGRTTYQQWKQGTPVPLNQLRPGDGVFFHMGPNGPEHVAIYIGNGRVVEDPHTGATVSVNTLMNRGAIGARRYA